MHNKKAANAFTQTVEINPFFNILLTSFVIKQIKIFKTKIESIVPIKQNNTGKKNK